MHIQEGDLFRQTIEVRDHSISERDTNISDLRKQTEAITERLKVNNKENDTFIFENCISCRLPMV